MNFSGVDRNGDTVLIDKMLNVFEGIFLRLEETLISKFFRFIKAKDIYSLLVRTASLIDICQWRNVSYK
jgi:hypothetical protein